jgi:hypothetical protein
VDHPIGEENNRYLLTQELNELVIRVSLENLHPILICPTDSPRGENLEEGCVRVHPIVHMGFQYQTGIRESKPNIGGDEVNGNWGFRMV